MIYRIFAFILVFGLLNLTPFPADDLSNLKRDLLTRGIDSTLGPDSGRQNENRKDEGFQAAVPVKNLPDPGSIRMDGDAGAVEDGAVGTETAQRGVVTVRSSLNVRDGAWGAVIGSLGPGAEVEIVGRDGEFLQIRYNGRIACVHSDYVRIDGAGNGVPPTVEPPLTGDGSGNDSGAVPGGPDDAAGSGDLRTLDDFQARDGLTGSDFLARIAGLSPAERERAIQEAILAGHLPPSLLQFRPVSVTRTLSDGRQHSITYHVAPDYLAVGTDSDNVRMPMTPVTAQAIADRLGCLLPTRRMVDQIYSAADTRLSPRAMSGGQYPDWQRRMTTSGFFAEHDRLIDGQLAGNARPGLVAGHKKDVVITNRLNSKPRSVAIYGWHRATGDPIQPLSTVHGRDYADYSHGVRLISGQCSVDGRTMSLAEVLRDPVLSGLVSDEGAMRDSRAVR